MSRFSSFYLLPIKLAYIVKATLIELLISIKATGATGATNHFWRYNKENFPCTA